MPPPERLPLIQVQKWSFAWGRPQIPNLDLRMALKLALLDMAMAMALKTPAPVTGETGAAPWRIAITPGIYAMA